MTNLTLSPAAIAALCDADAATRCGSLTRATIRIRDISDDCPHCGGILHLACKDDDGRHRMALVCNGCDRVMRWEADET